MRSLRAAIDWFAGSPARSFVFILLVAFSVRAIARTRVPESWVTPFGGGQEDKIAVSLLERGEYSSTYKVPARSADLAGRLLPIQTFVVFGELDLQIGGELGIGRAVAVDVLAQAASAVFGLILLEVLPKPVEDLREGYSAR